MSEVKRGPNEDPMSISATNVQFSTMYQKCRSMIARSVEDANALSMVVRRLIPVKIAIQQIYA